MEVIFAFERFSRILLNLFSRFAYFTYFTLHNFFFRESRERRSEFLFN